MRTIEEIQTEYNQTCAHMGSDHYRLSVIKSDFDRVVGELSANIEKHTARLKELSLEAEKVNKAAKPVEAEVVE